MCLFYCFFVTWNSPLSIPIGIQLLIMANFREFLTLFHVYSSPKLLIMQKKNFSFTLLILLVITGLAGTINLNPLTKKEKKVVIDQLKLTRDELVQSVKGLSENQLNFKPSADDWSVNECVQHLALTENLFRKTMDEMLEKTPNPEKRSEIKISDQDILAKMASREMKVKTYPTLTPENSTWSNTKDAMDEIKLKRKSLMQFLKTTETDMRGHVAESPMGMVDAYQIVLMNAAHTTRHTQQINEVKNHPLFPKE